jgi:DNA-binding NtrC family response regulator
LKKPAILVTEPDEPRRRTLKALFSRHGFDVIESLDWAGVHRCLQHKTPRVAIVGSSSPTPSDALELARRIRRFDGRIPIVLVTTHSSEELAIAALKAGITDYFKEPFAPEDLAKSVECRLSETPVCDVTAQPLIGDSLAMRDLKGYIGRVASTDSNVLITGETGTGKELVARLIHTNSRRQQKPFVSVNCAAIPESLLESELFGYERGAFTGAHSFREGKLKLADGGTALFDEIGDMSPHAQAKILRAIETKEVHRLGGRSSTLLDIRIVAATNQELEQSVARGTFRKDLYFRLNVARIHLPPLRERKEDIPILLDHYLREFNHRFDRHVEGFAEEALTQLLRYDWPGNVRELKNLLEAVFVTLPSPTTTLMELPEQFRKHLGEAADLPGDERDRVLFALFSTNWNKSKAAQKLHWSRMTLYRKLVKYHIVRSGGRSEDSVISTASLRREDTEP